MLKSQSILALRPSGIECFSIMSRHTLDDGITPDRRISIEGEHHLVSLAPSDQLVGDWYKGRVGQRTIDVFEEKFKPRYLHQLHKPIARRAVGQLIIQSMTSDISVMCMEETP